jgi:hypothetical protein
MINNLIWITWNMNNMKCEYKILLFNI